MPEISLDAQEFDQRKQEKLLHPKLYDQLKEVLPFENHVIWGHGTLSET